ncbi:MAG TPA: DUF3341 domain-containing protein [Bacteroidales bacterium]
MSKTQIIGIFDDEDTLMKAIHNVKAKNIEINEIFMPYPVHEAIEAMGKKTRFAFIAFLFGVFGAVSVLSFLYYTSVIDWPINYGGKPTNAFPSFMIITIVLTIFTVTILSLFAFSARSGIYPGKKYTMPDLRSTDDKFVIVFDKNNLSMDAAAFNSLLKESGASEILENEEK